MIQVSIEDAYTEACRALGEAQVRERLLLAEVQRLAAQVQRLAAESVAPDDAG